MTRDELLAVSREPNVAAFLQVLRACEGTAGERGYQTLYSYKYFDSFAGHPRRKISANGITSTAAGAYQIIEPTWDWLVGKYGFSDFSPDTQDAAAVALIIRRRALDAIREGDLDRAVDLTNEEWASLPGSPYGQPVRTMEFVRKVFALFGGREKGAAAPIEQRTFPPAPAPEPAPPPPPADPRPNDAFSGFDLRPAAPQPVRQPPMAPLIPALLGVLASIAPEIIKLVGDKSVPVAERNVAIGTKVLEIARDVAGGNLGAAAAVEEIAKDPVKQAAFREAIRYQWYELTEAGGGGIEGARKQAIALTQGTDWRSIGYGATIAILAFMIVGGGGYMLWSLIHDTATTAEQRGMLIGALVALISSPVAFFFGSSVSSRTKDTALVRELGQK